MAKIIDTLRRLDACDAAIAWVEGLPTLTPNELWLACSRGDWMLWLAAKLGVDRKTVVRASCACARTALRYVPAGEDRPRLAIETAEAWTRGEASLDEVRDAAYAADADAAAAAYAAADADAVDAAAYAADAAAAAYAAAAAAYATAYAADTAAAAAYAAAAAAAAARKQALRDAADIVRREIPFTLIRERL